VAVTHLLDIGPLSDPVQAEIAVPGSKSITNRALLLAALSAGKTTLKGALWSEDTEIMVNCLRSLGIEISLSSDPQESGNRTIVVSGKGGVILPGSSAERPVEIFVGNSGTTARFIAALVATGEGHYRLYGAPRMHERPQAALFDALQDLGYSVESSNDRLPAVIRGGGRRPGASCRVRIDESSQFASALLLAATRGGWEVKVEGENAEESPYVQLTTQIIAAFPAGGGVYSIEPDASSASYFWGADWVLRRRAATRFSTVRVANWMESSLQIDARFPKLLQTFPTCLSRRHDLGDSIMTAIVLAPFADSPKRFEDLGRLRVQESERVVALRTELEKCGAAITEERDTLHVSPGPLHGAEIETYDDHRIAMCFSILGLVVPGIRIRNPECVRKTFPDFFQKLSQPPPDGLGVRVRTEPS
jgi:3-phosphoshikimate 1-carboxyvinyltransferase